jgi:hypothetical protein
MKKLVFAALLLFSGAMMASAVGPPQLTCLTLVADTPPGSDTGPPAMVATNVAINEIVSMDATATVSTVAGELDLGQYQYQYRFALLDGEHILALKMLAFQENAIAAFAAGDSALYTTRLWKAARDVSQEPMVLATVRTPEVVYAGKVFRQST